MTKKEPLVRYGGVGVGDEKDVRSGSGSIDTAVFFGTA